MVLAPAVALKITDEHAALLRVLARRGEQAPCPSKGQNMNLNAVVDRMAAEMAYSQALQAWAAGLEPEVAIGIRCCFKPQR